MKSEILENNYIYIPNFISSYEAKCLANEFATYCATENKTGDVQVEQSQAEYNYVGFVELLCEKTNEVGKFLGEKVIPTYTYARIYQNNNDLKRHVDREACEISLTVHLDGDKEWPIHIKKPNGEEVNLILRQGDAMMYLGQEAEHWREKFEGEKYVQVFLHYVRSRGKNSWAMFDKIRDKRLVTADQSGVLTKEHPICEELEFNKSTMSTTRVLVEDDFIPNVLEDYIITFDDILSDDLCNQILKEYENETWIPAQVGSGVIDLSKRYVDAISISHQGTIHKTNSEMRKKIDEELFKCASIAIEKYKEMSPDCTIEEDSGYDLLRYKTGQYYKKHTDSFKQIPRAVSCSFALNDDYEGGEWGFFDNKIKIKPKKGSVVMFPSNFMYPHEINTVTKGTRYSIITWFI